MKLFWSLFFFAMLLALVNGQSLPSSVTLFFSDIRLGYPLTIPAMAEFAMESPLLESSAPFLVSMSKGVESLLPHLPVRLSTPSYALLI